MTPNPRDTYLNIAAALASRIQAQPDMVWLPSVHVLMDEFEVSRGVVLRAVLRLEEDGVIERVQGKPARVVQPGEVLDRRPLDERVADVLRAAGLKTGDPITRVRDLSAQFGVGQATMRVTLNKLADEGMLTLGKQGVPHRFREAQ